jgi:hypothetical protein
VLNPHWEKARTSRYFFQLQNDLKRLGINQIALCWEDLYLEEIKVQLMILVLATAV